MGTQDSEYYIINAFVDNPSTAVFKMQNASAGVNQDCLKAQKPEDMWKCMFAPVSTFTIKFMV